jgi:hypothetical protein
MTGATVMEPIDRVRHHHFLAPDFVESHPGE